MGHRCIEPTETSRIDGVGSLRDEWLKDLGGIWRNTAESVAEKDGSKEIARQATRSAFFYVQETALLQEDVAAGFLQIRRRNGRNRRNAADNSASARPSHLHLSPTSTLSPDAYSVSSPVSSLGSTLSRPVCLRSIGSTL